MLKKKKGNTAAINIAPNVTQNVYNIMCLWRNILASFAASHDSDSTAYENTCKIISMY